MKTCDKCKYVTWDFAVAYGGGYRFVDGCDLPAEKINIDEDYDDEWGDTKDCPYWEEIE